MPAVASRKSNSLVTMERWNDEVTENQQAVIDHFQLPQPGCKGDASEVIAKLKEQKPEEFAAFQAERSAARKAAKDLASSTQQTAVVATPTPEPPAPEVAANEQPESETPVLDAYVRAAEARYAGREGFEPGTREQISYVMSLAHKLPKGEGDGDPHRQERMNAFSALKGGASKKSCSAIIGKLERKLRALGVEF